jgi:hypothetical protein
MSQGPYDSLATACAKNPPADLFVLQPDLGTGKFATIHRYANTHLTSSLARCGISFPADFTIVDRRDSADPKRALTIWRLKKPAASG